MNEPVPFAERIPELATAYGHPRLVCLVKNINWVYVFWEILPEQIEEAEKQLGTNTGLRRMLRVRAGEKHQDIVADITVHGNLGAHYIHLDEAGQTYQVELVIGDGEQVVVLLTSNVFVTPFGCISEETDDRWSSISGLYENYRRQLAQHQTSSPAVWNVSSPLAKPPEAPEEGVLEVHTELILYGKAGLHDQVYVQGERIKTHEDGSFSLRYALPEGTFIYPVKAVSPNGQRTRSSVPVITRETY